MAKFGKLLLLAVLLGFFGAGCSAESPTSVSDVTPFPSGTYKALDYVWVLQEDGTSLLHNVNDPDTIYYGTYAISGDKVDITTDDLCPGGVKGTYKWEFDGKALKLITMKDNCVDRPHFATRSTWSLEQ
jgi:hypothetical protein